MTRGGSWGPLLSSNEEPANTAPVKDDRGGRMGSQGCNSLLEIPSPSDLFFLSVRFRAGFCVWLFFIFFFSPSTE